MATITTLDWLADELRPLYAGARPSPVTFAVEVWCGDEDDGGGEEGPFGWITVAEGVPQFALRSVLRHVRACGWSDATLSVGRDSPAPDHVVEG